MVIKLLVNLYIEFGDLITNKYLLVFQKRHSYWIWYARPESNTEEATGVNFSLRPSWAT